MQLKDPTLQQKLQEMCDCYMETEFADQLTAMSRGPSTDLEEDAVKYLALAIMYGVTEKARTLTLKRKKDETKVVLKTPDGKIRLPQPQAELFDGVIDLIRGILHFEGGGSSLLAMGLRNSQLDLQVELKEKEDKSSLKFIFPDLGE